MDGGRYDEWTKGIDNERTGGWGKRNESKDGAGTKVRRGESSGQSKSGLKKRRESGGRISRGSNDGTAHERERRRNKGNTYGNREGARKYPFLYVLIIPPLICLMWGRGSTTVEEEEEERGGPKRENEKEKERGVVKYEKAGEDEEDPPGENTIANWPGRVLEPCGGKKAFACPLPETHILIVGDPVHPLSRRITCIFSRWARSGPAAATLYSDSDMDNKYPKDDHYHPTITLVSA
ncbi:hypothetical protein BDQ17DRAFT_1472496 [Cyathus striatus]|nr:hypothetical protein BDQ17DRAFT_1472496 [Cyathus striatus]